MTKKTPEGPQPATVEIEAETLKEIGKVMQELREDYDLALNEAYEGKLNHPSAVRDYQRKGHIIKVAGQVKEKIDEVLKGA